MCTMQSSSVLQSQQGERTNQKYLCDTFLQQQQQQHITFMLMLSSSAYAFLLEASPAHPCMPQQLAHLFFIIWFQSSALAKEVVILLLQGRKQTMFTYTVPFNLMSQLLLIERLICSQQNPSRIITEAFLRLNTIFEIQAVLKSLLT